MDQSAVNIGLYVILSGVLFTIGIVGVLVRRSAIMIFMAIELMLNSANLALVAFARQHGGVDGQIIAFLVMVIAAAEVAVGLTIIVAVFRRIKTVDVDKLHSLKG